MKKYIIISTISLAIGLVSCAENKSESGAESYGTAALDSASVTMEGDISLPAKRQFVRTAQLNFRVKDVQKTTNDITELTKKWGGFVTNSTMSSNVISSQDVAISQDSLMRNETFELSNQITLRIPTVYFDEALVALQPYVLFMESQSIGANDVSLELLASQVRKSRFSNFEKKYNQEIKKGTNLKETAPATENLYNIQSQADTRRIETLALKDQVAYSTINIHIYQPAQVHMEVIANLESEAFKRPNFGVSLIESINQGWYLFQDLVLFFTRFWMLLVLGGLGYWGFRKMKKAL